ncbi:MAG: hypothetical protein E7588_07745 [Ruminococcaceae bacterium]|nr:hypothetical protein [Oscillospiraceae bacterium]
MFKVTSEKRVKANMKTALFVVLFLLPFIVLSRVIINIKYIEEATGYSTSAVPVVHFAAVVVLSLVVLLLAKAFEIFYLSKSFDPTSGDYTPNNISPYSELIFNKTSVIVVFMSAFLGFAMITSFFLMLFNLYKPSIETVPNKLVFIIMTLFMALAGVFFIISATKNPSPYRKYYASLSFAPVLWSALRIMMCFMDTSRYINTTSRHLELFTSIAVTLFFMYQSRFTLQNYKYHKMGTYFSFGLIATIFISSSSVPSIISVAFFPYTVQMANENDAIFWLLDIITLFYIIVRLIRISSQINTVTQEDLTDYARGYTKSILKQ